MKTFICYTVGITVAILMGHYFPVNLPGMMKAAVTPLPAVAGPDVMLYPQEDGSALYDVPAGRQLHLALDGPVRVVVLPTPRK